MPKIIRLTLFKIPEDAAIQEAVKKYSTLTQDAVKVSFESTPVYVYREPYMDLGRPSPTSTLEPAAPCRCEHLVTYSNDLTTRLSPPH
jgi:hypothetical protein